MKKLSGIVPSILFNRLSTQGRAKEMEGRA